MTEFVHEATVELADGAEVRAIVIGRGRLPVFRLDGAWAEAARSAMGR